ncbi:MAG TPA: GNAT family N-acetyltransferase [Bacteroidales bacterium]|nr:GNAT family N-acetyltransferase [Bacteroidales bacterium]MDD4236470.1 GNAT family N-acetyltransferase [Bacteroidales bacterium]HRW20837.1 GNAT family N-acetyltransferase [Bacteroidales bacterium]
MKIRPAIINDREKILEFQLNLAMETENLELDRKTVLNGINSVINDSSKGKYFVAENDKDIIACLMITPEWSDWRCAWMIWLQSVYVVPEYRNKGVFKTLYNYIKDIVQNNIDYKGIRLYVDNSNKSAAEVYRKVGMCGEHYSVWEWIK